MPTDTPLIDLNTINFLEDDIEFVGAALAWQNKAQQLEQEVQQVRGVLTEQKQLREQIEAIKRTNEILFGYQALSEVYAEQILKLRRENFALAAGQCLHGLIGDDYGNPYCPRIRELEQEIAKLRGTKNDGR